MVLILNNQTINTDIFPMPADPNEPAFHHTAVKQSLCNLRKKSNISRMTFYRWRKMVGVTNRTYYSYFDVALLSTIAEQLGNGKPLTGCPDFRVRLAKIRKLRREYAKNT